MNKPKHNSEVPVKIIHLSNSDKIAFVDDADYAAVSEFSWRWDALNINRSGGKGYVCRYLPVSEHGRKGRSINQTLHQFLLGSRSGLQIDHVDADSLNNQRVNLRWATTSQNQANRLKQPGATSQYKGVSVRKKYGDWTAGIRVMGRSINLGYFSGEADAARAYDHAALEHFGEFARLNFPQPEN